MHVSVQQNKTKLASSDRSDEVNQMNKKQPENAASHARSLPSDLPKSIQNRDMPIDPKELVRAMPESQIMYGDKHMLQLPGEWSHNMSVNLLRWKLKMVRDYVVWTY